MEHGKGKVITISARKRVEKEMNKLLPSVKIVAATLQQNGFRHNDVLGITGPNSLEWITIDLACIYCGIKLLPIDPRHDQSLLHDKDLPINAILIADEFISTHQITKPAIHYIPFSQLLNATTPVDGIVPYLYDDKEVFSYKTTSGSTGVPKIIGHSLGSINNSIVSCQSL